MKKLILIFFGMIYCTIVFASNTSFMNYSPVFYFSTEDTQIMRQSMINTLNSARDNSKVTWRNPKTGTNGYFIPSQTTVKNGSKCRNLTIFNEANHVTGKATYQFCKIKGNWEVAQ